MARPATAPPNAVTATLIARSGDCAVTASTVARVFAADAQGISAPPAFMVFSQVGYARRSDRSGIEPGVLLIQLRMIETSAVNAFTPSLPAWPSQWNQDLLVDYFRVYVVQPCALADAVRKAIAAIAALAGQLRAERLFSLPKTASDRLQHLQLRCRHASRWRASRILDQRVLR